MYVVVKGKNFNLSIFHLHGHTFYMVLRFNDVLIAHNGKNLDILILSKAAKNCNLYVVFTHCVAAFVNSLAVFRNDFRGLKNL